MARRAPRNRDGHPSVVLRLLLLVALVASFLVLVTPSPASAATTASDDFHRAEGGVGAAWGGVSDGGLVIASQAVVGTKPSGTSGDIRVGEVYASDQGSQVQLTATQLSGGRGGGGGGGRE